MKKGWGIGEKHSADPIGSWESRGKDRSQRKAAADGPAWVTSILFGATTDLGGVKAVEVTGWNSPYYSADRQLYCQLSTTGTPNIAAGRMPQVQVFVLPFAGSL